MFEHLRNQNTHIDFFHITDKEFESYGKVVTGYDFTEMISIMAAKEIPSEGNIYVSADDDLMNASIISELSETFYGHMPIQAGYCNGNSFKLNALEYHKGSEIDIAITDLVLLLSDIRCIDNNKLASSSVKAFFVPAGTACELYGTTLHFAPCKVSDKGYKSIIILPAGTNQPLKAIPAPNNNEDQLLWMQNKWLIAHPESIPASKGACAGITGSNIEIFY